MDVVMIRHAVTAWNEAGRVQGQTDVPLGESGRRALAGRRLPARFASYRVHSSPLARAVETAALLGLGVPALDRRLMEMHWGEWEGETRASVAAADPDGVARNTARGRDFRPPGGESPREVQARIVDWGRSVARLPHGGNPSVPGERSAGSRRPIDPLRDGSLSRPEPSLPPSPGNATTTPGVVAVTHKGVIKATLGLACDWDLTGKAPVRLDWACAHRFRFDPRTGEFMLEEPNLRLERERQSAMIGTVKGAVTVSRERSPPGSGSNGSGSSP